MTEPKIADPIVFHYTKSHLKLTAVRQGLTSTKAALPWREATADEDPTDTFTYRLDPSGSRATDVFCVTLNKPGLYEIASSVAVQLFSGTADVGITLDVQYPGQPITETAYSESNVTDFDNVHVTIPVRVLPYQVGARIYIYGKATLGSPVVRGWNTGSNAYEAGGQTGSFVDIVYEGP